MNLSFKGIQPTIDPTVYVAPGAVIIGDVVIGPELSVRIEPWIHPLRLAVPGPGK